MSSYRRQLSFQRTMELSVSPNSQGATSHRARRKQIPLLIKSHQQQVGACQADPGPASEEAPGTGSSGKCSGLEEEMSP